MKAHTVVLFSANKDMPQMVLCELNHRIHNVKRPKEVTTIVHYKLILNICPHVIKLLIILC